MVEAVRVRWGGTWDKKVKCKAGVPRGGDISIHNRRASGVPVGEILFLILLNNRLSF